MSNALEDYFVLDFSNRTAVSGWLPIPRNADDSLGSPKELEIVLESSPDSDYEQIDEALYDDSKLDPIPDIGFSEPQDTLEFVESESSDSGEVKPTTDPEDLKALRRMIHHLGRLTIEVQMLRVQEQEVGSCMAAELAEAEEAMRQAVEELVQIKHHWGSGV